MLDRYDPKLNFLNLQYRLWYQISPELILYFSGTRYSYEHIQLLCHVFI